MNYSEHDYGLDLSSFESYKASSLKLITSKLESFYHKSRLGGITLNMIQSDINALNAYPGIMKMSEVRHDEIIYIDDDAETTRAEKAVLDGKIFFEHAAAGEATRLGIGTKYLIRPGDLTFSRIREILIKEAKNDSKTESELLKISAIPDEVLLKECGNTPGSLIQLSIGTRHMIQLVYDIQKLAKKHGVDPSAVIKRQKMLIILNEATSGKISEEIMRYSFFSLDPKNVYFMEQRSFHGITIDENRIYYDEHGKDGAIKDNLRLHNHGQMVMQKLHDDSIYRLDNNERKYISRKEFFTELESCDDMISYNIEDLGYLTSSLDFKSLATALTLKDKGFKMVMEVVGQNQKKPQKGASLFKDPSTDKNYMIESFRLADMKPEQMRLMNKNFNHYPDPCYSLKKVAEKGLMLGFEVKTASDGKDYIYLCPVQGDINFIVPTAFVTRKILKPIFNWKSASQTTQAVKAMHDQEMQDDWKVFARSLKLI